MLKKTTLLFENNNHESPRVFDNLPDDFRNQLMKAIIAFEVEVESIDNVFKPGELIESMELFEEVKEKLLFGNAMEWLGRR